MKRSEEEEIKRALQATISGEASADDDEIISDAISELLTLRRRLGDRDAIAAVILYEETKNKPNSFKVADAIIKYLTEGNSGE